MDFLDKIKNWTKKGIGFFKEVIDYVAAFAVAIVSAPFNKNIKFPTSDEINEEYINNVEKKETAKDLELRDEQINKNDTYEKFKAELDTLNTMDTEVDNEKIYTDVIRNQIFKGCEVILDDDKNILIKFPERRHENRTKGTLIIETAIKFDKDGNYIEGKRDYYNANTRFRKTYNINKTDINPTKCELMVKACELINLYKQQEQTTFDAKGYTECIHQHFIDNDLTKEKIVNVLNKMNIEIDKYGNVINHNEANKFAVLAAQRLVASIRAEYNMNNNEAFFEALESKTNQRWKDMIIEKSINSIKEYIENNDITKEYIKDMLESLDVEIDNDGEIVPKNKDNNKIDPNKIQIAEKIILIIRDKYGIDKNENIYDAIENHEEKIEKVIKEEVNNDNDIHSNTFEERETSVKTMNDLGEKEDDRLKEPESAERG